MRTLVLVVALAACCCSRASEDDKISEYGYKVVHAYPHDPKAFTQGLVYLNGFLYEGTGLAGESSIRKVKLETGEVLQKHDVPPPYFGEGIINWKDRLLELTWQGGEGFIYDLANFAPQGNFKYGGEGWGLTADGEHIIMSDGTPELRFWNPETLQEVKRVTVMDASGQLIRNLNELEWVKGEVYANVWQTDRIARINPQDGKVKGWIDLTGLWPGSDNFEKTLNGIAYDAQHDRLFVTGKKWPTLFEIQLVPRTAAQ